ncbi:hypothetical protein V3C99_010983 [Haemonchus contortus]
MQQQNAALKKVIKEVKLKTKISGGVEVQDSKVVAVLPSSELLGTVFVGDQIIAVNGMPTPTTQEFNTAVNSKLPGSVMFEFMRDEMCSYEMKPLTPWRPGHDPFQVTLTWRSGGTPIGLLIHRDFSGRIVIAMVESGCTASKVIKPGDQLLKVNHADVKDRDVARQMINESINASKKVTLTVERCVADRLPSPTLRTAIPPVTASKSQRAAARTPVGSQRSIKSPKAAAPVLNTKLDVALPADVLAILEANKEFFLAECTQPPCLKKPAKSSENVVLPGNEQSHMGLPQSVSTETVIPYDPSPKALKITPKRVGS